VLDNNGEAWQRRNRGWQHVDAFIVHRWDIFAENYGPVALIHDAAIKGDSE
jgi:hypothetical protein